MSSTARVGLGIIFKERIMGYNLSRFSVNRNLPQLDLLLNAETDIRFETNEPRKLASKLREALLASREFEDLVYLYDGINPNFTFIEEENAVLAKYNFVSDGVPVGEMDVREDHKLARQAKGTVESARTLLDVIGGGVKGDEGRYEEIYFPNAVLSREDQKRLWDWTETTDWGFIDHQEKGLTLTKSEEYEGIVWRPEG